MTRFKVSSICGVVLAFMQLVVSIAVGSATYGKPISPWLDFLASGPGIFLAIHLLPFHPQPVHLIIAVVLNVAIYGGAFHTLASLWAAFGARSTLTDFRIDR